MTVRTHRTESSESQMHALLVAFAVSHFVLVLHHDTHLDLQLLGKLRSLQVLNQIRWDAAVYAIIGGKEICKWEACGWTLDLVETWHAQMLFENFSGFATFRLNKTN